MLKERREHLRISRTRAAQLSGINASTIESWEVGRTAKPPIHDVLRLARVLGIPIADLERIVLDEDVLPTATADATAGARKAADAAKQIETIGLPLFNRAAALLGWSDSVAAATLNTSVSRVAELRRGEGELSVLEVLTLVAVLGAFSSREGGVTEVEVDELLQRLRGARV